MTLDVRGKTVVLTGTFSRLKRAAAEAQLKALGAKVVGAVSKSTHVLFAGEMAGSKINAANKLGVTVLGEDALIAVLGGGAAPEVSRFVVDAGLAGETLAREIEGLAWETFVADRDLPGLRAALMEHEAAHGITAAHRAATAKIRPLALLAHAHGHDVEVEWSDMSPDGRFLATGSWTGEDYERGGVLQIWDVGAGRCVNMLRVRGGVGWPDYPGCVRWRPDGRRVGLAFATNGVGSFDPFGKSGEPESCAYITDGWSRPPAWAWAPNSRDVYIACWGPKLELGAVVPLVGRDPEPRWCASIEREDPTAMHSEPRLQPMKTVWWNHPERIVGVSGWNQVFALDARTGQLLWDGDAAPPVVCSPDGEELAMHPAGLAYYDTKTGLANGKAPLHVGASEFLWSRDGSRVVAVVQPDNAYSAAPGLFVYERGVYRGSVDAPAPRTNGTYAAAWSPDGRRLAVTSRGRLQIWEVEGTACKLDVAAPGDGVQYGDGVLVAWGKFGLTFVREADGAVIGAFKLAIEASDTSPLAPDGDDFADGMAWDPAFPVDDERVAAALPEGVVIGPSEAPASVAEIDAKIAWVVDRKWAWPWRWGEAKVWPDPAAACADRAASAAFKRRFAKKEAKQAKVKATAPVNEKVKAAPAAKPGKQVKTWPPAGGSIDAVVGLLESCVRKIDGGYHAGKFRRDLAVRAMKLGLFDRAVTAIEDGPGWAAAWDPWWSAYARGATVMAALGRSDAAALTNARREMLRRWLVEGEEALTRIGPTWTACRPQAMLGAAWVLLGEAERGEAWLARALAGMDPESNPTEHRAVIAEAYVALGRVGTAIDALTSSARVHWTYAGPAIAEICKQASVAELERLRGRMAEQQDQSESILFNRGLERLIVLKEWDAARAWLAGFTGVATWDGEVRLVAAMFAAGEAARAEATGRLVDPADPRCAEVLLGMTRVDPERARVHLERIFNNSQGLLAAAAYRAEFLAVLAVAAVRLGRLDMAGKLEAMGRDRGESQAVRLRVLAELDPADAAWAEWFARACDGAPDGEKGELAALASRGRVADAAARLDAAIEVAREGWSADLGLEELSRQMIAVGDLAGAHRAWLAIAKGKRSARNGRLIDACVAVGAWAGVVELLAAMSTDLNGAPNKASHILLKLTGGEGW